MVKELLLVILLKIVMVDIYLDRELIYLLLLNNGGIGYIVLIVNRSIPLDFIDNIRTVNRTLVRILIDYILLRSFGFINHSYNYLAEER